MNRGTKVNAFPLAALAPSATLRRCLARDFVWEPHRAGDISQGDDAPAGDDITVHYGGHWLRWGM